MQLAHILMFRHIVTIQIACIICGPQKMRGTIYAWIMRRKNSVTSITKSLDRKKYGMETGICEADRKPKAVTEKHTGLLKNKGL